MFNASIFNVCGLIDEKKMWRTAEKNILFVLRLATIKNKKTSFTKNITMSSNQSRLQAVIQRNRRSIFQFTSVRGPLNVNAYSGTYEFDLQMGLSRWNTVATRNAFRDNTISNGLEGLFDRIVQYVVVAERLEASDRIQMRITSGRHVWTPLIRVSQMTGAYFLSRIELLLSSFEDMQLEGAQVSVDYFKQLKITGVGVYTNATEFTSKKKCVVSTHSNMCVWECIMIGKAEHEDINEFKKYVKAGSRRSLDKAKMYMKQCGLMEEVAMTQFPLIENQLGISILVVEFCGMRIVYKSKDRSRPIVCMLMSGGEDGAHVDYVRVDKIGRLWERARFCKKCLKGYASDDKHACFGKCIACKRASCKGMHAKGWNDFTKICDMCNCKFYDTDCFKFHLKKMCEKYSKCPNCNFTFKRSEEHECGMRTCTNCSKLTPIEGTHKCFHQRLNDGGLAEPSEKYIFYDYETYLGENNAHVVVGIVAWDIAETDCRKFFSTSEFVGYLLKPELNGYTCIAHNGGRYDFHFIKQEFLQRGVKSIDVCNGRTIFYSYVTKLKMRFIDSYKLIPIPLRKFSSAFGLSEISKGYFPYRFLSEETRGYVGPLPPIEFYDFDKMGSSERLAGMKWYESMKDKEINLMDMCWEYCTSDVVLLKEGCMKFRKLFLDITDNRIDPLQYITIASVCMTLYRRFFLPENAIGIIEPKSEEQLRKKAMYKEFEKLRGYDSREFLYCVDNGCEKCTYPFTPHPVSGLLMKDLRHECMKRTKDTLVIWEHEVAQIPGIEEFDECEFKYVNNDANIRDAFCGGRTEPFVLYRKCKPNERMRYVDFTSLYPSVQFGMLHGVTESTYNHIEELRFPVGHPVELHNVRPEELHQYFGFVKCSIECPSDLQIPILPEKRDGKLMFDLTPKTGTWAINEVVLAMSFGYEVTKVFSVLHFKESSKTLFREYIKRFLKLKMEAAGWRAHGCVTEDEKDKFISDYEYEMGITLEKAYIEEAKNDGMYLIAKLCLNSLWGKYAQRDYRTNTCDVFSWTEFQKVVDREDVDIKGVIMHGSFARTITTEKKKEYTSAPKYTNIAIAAMTTSYARCRLYKALSVLQPDQVMYVDTDSIIFVEDVEKGGALITGPNLGDLTDELDGDYIVEFVSTGPKSYAYRTLKGYEVVKVKGVRISHDSAKVVNFASLFDMAKSSDVFVRTYPMQFVIDEHHNISTKKWNEGEGKQLRRTMNKRNIDDDNADEWCIPTTPFKRLHVDDEVE